METLSELLPKIFNCKVQKDDFATKISSVIGSDADKLDKAKKRVQRYLQNQEGYFELGINTRDGEKKVFLIGEAKSWPKEKVKAFSDKKSMVDGIVNLKNFIKAIDNYSEGIEDSDVKRPKPKNDTAKKMYKTAEKNQPKKDAIIEEAVQLIRDTGKDFKTEKNNCKKWLWDHPKIQKIDSGNARGWLDKAIDEGTINRKLKELPME